MAISAADVKKLREMTGAGMMDCKKALTEAGGDFDKAVEELRKKGQKVSEKRADRDASEGAIFIAQTEDGSRGVMVELNCETDFVARNEDFQAFGNKIAQAALAQKPHDAADLTNNLELDGKKLADILPEYIGKIGEKIEVSKYATLEAEQVVSYLHIGGRVGVLVAFDHTAGASNLQDVGKDVAMQVAAMNPIALDESEVSDEIKAREKRIAIDQLKEDPKNANKPDEILEKIVVGKVNKYFKENTLLAQEFVKDPSKTVAAHVASASKDLKVKAFKRLHLGG